MKIRTNSRHVASRLLELYIYRFGKIPVLYRLCFGMNHRFRQICIVLFAAMHVVTGLLLDGSHHDPDALCLNGVPALSTHTCGAHQRHLPADQADRCSACVQTAQRVSTPAVNPFQLNSLLVLQYVSFPRCERPSSGSSYAATNRGPPYA